MAKDIDHMTPEDRRAYALTFLREAQYTFDQSASGKPTPERAAAAASIATAHLALAQLDVHLLNPDSPRVRG